MKKISALAIAGVFTASLAATAFAEMAEVKVGGEIRVRDVVTNNYDYDKDAADRNNTVTSRTRINVDAKIDETTKAYVSLQDTRVWGEDINDAGAFDTATTGNDDNAVDVSQAYLQLDKLFGQPLSLKLGRQMLAYGEHRLVGNFEWSNYGRRFDALKLMYNTDAVSVDLWSAKVKEEGALNGVGTEVPAGATTGSYTTNNEDAYFNGLYVTVKGIPTSTLDLYALQKTNTDSANDLNVLTYGARLNGAAAGVDWTLEGALQTGEVSETVDKDASFFAARAGYTIPNTPSLRIGGEYVYASGNDSAAAGDDDEAFDNLYPTNHPLYGVSDVAVTNTLSNLTAWSINVSAKPVKGLKLLAEYWNYERTEDKLDTITGAASNANEDAIGTEFNIQAWYALTPNVDLHAYWARFSPDDGVTGGGTAEDDEADNVTLQVAVKF